MCAVRNMLINSNTTHNRRKNWEAASLAATGSPTKPSVVRPPPLSRVTAHRIQVKARCEAPSVLCDNISRYRTIIGTTHGQPGWHHQLWSLFSGECCGRSLPTQLLAEVVLPTARKAVRHTTSVYPLCVAMRVYPIRSSRANGLCCNPAPRT